MSDIFSNWKTDNYKFVGKAFDFAYANRLNKLSPIVGEVNARSIDYELTGSGGYGYGSGYGGGYGYGGYGYGESSGDEGPDKDGKTGPNPPAAPKSGKE